MPSDEDVFVVIVANENEDILQLDKNEFPSVDEKTFEEFVKTLETQEKRVKEIDIKQETIEIEENCIKDEIQEEFCDEYIKVEYVEDDEDQSSNEQLSEIVPDVISPMIEKSKKRSDSHIHKNSDTPIPITISRMKRENPELKKNQKLLIREVVNLMLKEKPPPTPDNVYEDDGSKFNCVYCEKVTDRLYTAVRHYRENHGPRYLHCFGCGDDFRRTASLYGHEKRCVSADAVTVLKARAMFLGKKGRSRPFITKTPYLQKMVTSLEEFEARKYIAKSTKSYCDSNKPKRIRHVPTQIFECEDCGASFNDKNRWIGHCNLHKGLRPYRCDQCPASYPSHIGLWKHARTHRGVRFICDYCGRNLSNKQALIKHIDTHFKKRLHACKECPKRYAAAATLALHVYKHHRKMPPPCVCQVCPKSFYRTYLLKEHMMKEHGMLLVTRGMFYRSLPTMPTEELEKILVKKEFPF